MIRAITFDCFGVLTADIWREFTATLPEDQRNQASELNRQYGAAYLTRREFLDSIEELTNIEVEQLEALLSRQTAKNSALLNYIAELGKTYKIGLLSNVGSNWIRDEFLSVEEQLLFDAFIFSYEVRVAKPDPRIFEIMADRLGVELSECVMVDDVQNNCEIAKSLGMEAIEYRDFIQFKSELTEILSPNTIS